MQQPFPSEITETSSLSRVKLEIPEVQQVSPLLAPSLGFFHQFSEDFCSL